MAVDLLDAKAGMEPLATTGEVGDELHHDLAQPASSGGKRSLARDAEPLEITGPALPHAGTGAH